MTDDSVTDVELAAWLGVSDRQVRDLAKRKVISRASRGRYPLRASLLAVLNHLREVAAGRASADDVLDLVTERARLARSQAVAQERRNKAAIGELFSAQDAEDTFGAVLDAIRTAFLALPTRITPLVADQPYAAVHAKLTEAVREVLTRLSEDAVENVVAEVARRSRARAARNDG